MAEGKVWGTLLATIIGGLIGVGGTIGTVVLTQQEAEDVETKRATGAARLLADNLRRGEDVMADSLTDCRYRLYDVLRTLALPHDDLVLLAWRLEPAEWETVAQAMSAVRLQVARQERLRPGTELNDYDVKQIRFVIRRIDRARHALEDLSGVKPYAADKVKGELARGTDC